MNNFFYHDKHYLKEMKMQQKINFKKKLQQNCISILEDRISSSYNAMLNAQTAANNEEKSSAGDKYETGRAMNHLEKDMYAKQWFANKKELATLLTINCNKTYEWATAGSIVQCSEFSFFIAAGLGKIFIDKELFFLLSPYAPIAILLNNKKAGDAILFNKKELIIQDVY